MSDPGPEAPIKRLRRGLCLALVAALPPAHAAASWLLGIGGCALLLGAANHQAAGLVIVPGDLVQLLG